MIKQLKTVVKTLIHWSHCSTGVLDLFYSQNVTKMTCPPVFIIGPPRSGTTLLFQSLVHTYHFAYITNLANRFYMSPVYANHIALKYLDRYRSSFGSRYGFENGLTSPSESGNIWNRWFPQETRDGFNYTPAGFLSPEKQKTVFQVIANMERRGKLPFLIKNGKSCVRLHVLKEIFPDAIFIRISRDFADTACSILVKRRRSNRNWWSVMPKEVDMIRGRSEFEEVSLQVFYIEKNLAEDLTIFPAENIISLAYRDLCSAPEQQLETIRTFLQAKGYKLKPTKNALPDHFDFATPVANQYIREEEIARIREITKNILQNNH